MNRDKLLKMRGGIIAFDLDSTLTIDEVEDFYNKTPNQVIEEMRHLIPNMDMINLLNEVAKHNTVYIYTARNDCFQEVTNWWLKEHGVNCNYFLHNKEFYTCFIDDKACRPEELR